MKVDRAEGTKIRSVTITLDDGNAPDIHFLKLGEGQYVTQSWKGEMEVIGADALVDLIVNTIDEQSKRT